MSACTSTPADDGAAVAFGVIDRVRNEMLNRVGFADPVKVRVKMPSRMSVALKPAIRALYADGDTVVVLFDASATTIDDKPYRNTYAWFLQMRAGRIVNATAFFDSIEFNELWTRVAPKSAG